MTETDKKPHGRGYCPLEFIPSEEAVIDALNSDVECHIHYYLLGNTVVTNKLSNNNEEITGPYLYNKIRSQQFVKIYRQRIEKIVVSVD